MASVTMDETPIVTIYTYDEVPITVETYSVEEKKRGFPWWVLIILGVFGYASYREYSK